MTEYSGRPCPLCGNTDSALSAVVKTRPACEIDYGITPERYFRRIYRCRACTVFFNDHECLPASLYSGAYNDATYGERFRARYDAIMSLPPAESDNKQRAKRLHAALQQRGLNPSKTRVLDIGVGLGVFLAEMRKYGYRTYAVDPDPRAVRHAREVVGVDDAWVGTLEELRLNSTFELITLNKVLEHVPSPVSAASVLRNHIKPDGTVYIELPDGDAAAVEGFVNRQEFNIEHLTVYGPDSLRWLIDSAGLLVNEMQRVREPSGKFTIFALAGRPATKPT
jgi:SAM-dependent methyltransferase